MIPEECISHHYACDCREYKFDQLQSALRTLITAAKSMPENPHTPSQMALDDAIEAAEKVVGEVECSDSHEKTLCTKRPSYGGKPF